MDSLLTVNKLGFIEKSGDLFYLNSESGQVMICISKSERTELVSAIISKISFVELRDCQMKVSFLHPEMVCLLWDTQGMGTQTAVFNETDLVQFLDVDSVRTLVLSRQS